MALPYTIVLSIVGVVAIESGFLVDMTQSFYDSHMLLHHSAAEAVQTMSGGH